ncbi:hypothetical protein BH23ACT2_BH23ACT2_01760 [soil metagenome]
MVADHGDHGKASEAVEAGNVALRRPVLDISARQRAW